MAAVPDPMPHPVRRADTAYLDFVEGFREYLLGKGADFEDRLGEALAAEEQRRGAPMRDLDEI